MYKEAALARHSGGVVPALSRFKTDSDVLDGRNDVDDASVLRRYCCKKTMWNCIVNRSDSSVAVNGRCQVPSTRCKHAICYDVDKNRVYLLGGRNGNIPLKDFWTYSIGMQLHVNFISCVHLRLLMCIFLVLVPH